MGIEPILAKSVMAAPGTKSPYRNQLENIRRQLPTGHTQEMLSRFEIMDTKLGSYPPDATIWPAGPALT